MTNREIAEQIFLAGVSSVLPERLITGMMSINGSIMKIQDQSFPLTGRRNIFLIGAGKASAAMGHYVETIMGNRITGGHIVVKYDHSCKLNRTKVTEAGHPVPDINGFRATEEIKKIAQHASENDLVICLLSGGGSALLADLPEGILPEELYIVNNLLIRSGASISEINCVRKHLSEIKGGQLSRMAWPATIVSLILSDVIGDPLDVIASGPTAPDPSTFNDALRIIEYYHLASDVTNGILNYLKEGSGGMHPETPKPDDPLFSRTFNFLAGTNRTALEAAKDKAISLGLNTHIVESELRSDVETASETIVNAAIAWKKNNGFKKPACLLYGGEPTLKVNGNGSGGRNQHLALSAAIRLNTSPGITLLSAGTDGTDGPTDAAGAVVDSETVNRAGSLKADPEVYLAEFDSYNFFGKTGGQIKTGPTFTNVMDMVVVLIE